MKFPDIGSDLADEIGSLFQVSLLGRVRIDAEITQRRRQNVVGGIQHVDAAILEFSEILRLEHHVPAVDLRIGTEDLLRHRDVVADAGSARDKSAAIATAVRMRANARSFRMQLPLIGGAPRPTAVPARCPASHLSWQSRSAPPTSPRPFHRTPTPVSPRPCSR